MTANVLINNIEYVNDEYAFSKNVAHRLFINGINLSVEILVFYPLKLVDFEP